MCQRLNFAESAKIALSGGRLDDLMTERPRRILILWNWFPSICGGPLGYNLREGKYTLCPSWMEDHPTNLVLTFLINQTHPLLRLSMLFGLRPSPCLGVRFAGFALIGHTKQWLGKITVATMESSTNLLPLTHLPKMVWLSAQSVQRWMMCVPYFRTPV